MRGKDKKYNHNPKRVELNNDNFKFNPGVGGSTALYSTGFAIGILPKGLLWSYSRRRDPPKESFGPWEEHRWLFKVIPLQGKVVRVNYLLFKIWDFIIYAILIDY